MTRKDYIIIAAAIKTACGDIRAKEVNHIDLCNGAFYAAEHIADALKQNNPLFDRAKFLTACGVN